MASKHVYFLRETAMHNCESYTKVCSNIQIIGMPLPSLNGQRCVHTCHALGDRHGAHDNGYENEGGERN